jgi:hypothetical protein
MSRLSDRALARPPRRPYDTVLGRALIATIGEDVDAAGDLR